MKLLRLAAVALVILLLAVASVYYLRGELAGHWIKRTLVAHLESEYGAKAELHGLSYLDGKLRIGSGKISGGDLPFADLEIEKMSADVPWRELLEPGNNPVSIHAERAKVTMPSDQAERVGAEKPWTGPTMEIAVDSFTFEQPGGWTVRDTRLGAKRTEALWFLQGQGGMLDIDGGRSWQLERVTAEEKENGWNIPSFALRDDGGGMIGGSANKTDEIWNGEFSWQDIVIGSFWSAERQQLGGKAAGDAVLANNELRGKMIISGATTQRVPQLVRLASLFAGENWETLPWETFRFEFTRSADGRVHFRDLVALSSKGLAVRGGGHYATENIGAELQLGVRREGRPWLIAFIPVLFRGERDGYLWTTVRVSGTPQDPKEDLSTRIVAALAAAPATEAAGAAVEIPAGAVEAAGDMLKRLMGH